MRTLYTKEPLIATLIFVKTQNCVKRPADRCTPVQNNQKIVSKYSAFHKGIRRKNPPLASWHSASIFVGINPSNYVKIQVEIRANVCYDLSSVPFTYVSHCKTQ